MCSRAFMGKKQGTTDQNTHNNAGYCDLCALLKGGWWGKTRHLGLRIQPGEELGFVDENWYLISKSVNAHPGDLLQRVPWTEVLISAPAACHPSLHQWW
ncbi:hypothetical protein JOB18_021467 [Solea senegalensis]|uniref:Uncharacterized protein n=1 Tax=Solea senegalensis TaxID=28829 RepID=A0AAV6SJV1_SOLSE|nr:hypothetical protein JOB18_021467 [Solea senegalensis]